MGLNHYEIVFCGERVPGARLEQVKSNLAKLYRADEQRIALLFSGRRLVLKNHLDADTAEKYRATLERAGALVRVVEMQMAVEEIELSASAFQAHFAAGGQEPVRPRDAYMAAFSDVVAPNLGLAQIGSDLQQAKAAEAAPRLDLSHLSLAPVGTDIGQLPAPPVFILPDISHLQLL